MTCKLGLQKGYTKGLCNIEAKIIINVSLRWSEVSYTILTVQAIYDNNVFNCLP